MMLKHGELEKYVLKGVLDRLKYRNFFTLKTLCSSIERIIKNELGEYYRPSTLAVKKHLDRFVEVGLIKSGFEGSGQWGAQWSIKDGPIEVAKLRMLLEDQEKYDSILPKKDRKKRNSIKKNKVTMELCENFRQSEYERKCKVFVDGHHIGFLTYTTDPGYYINTWEEKKRNWILNLYRCEQNIGDNAWVKWRSRWRDSVEHTYKTIEGALQALEKLEYKTKDTP